MTRYLDASHTRIVGHNDDDAQAERDAAEDRRLEHLHDQSLNEGDDDEADADDGYCITCAGSGEGLWDGARCVTCGGSGAA